MNGLLTRSAVLAFARLSNYATMLLSPIFLVRILDVETYGQYREFILYAMLIASFMGFSINRSLLFFIPQNNELKKYYITNTVIFCLISFIIGLLLLFVFKEEILNRMSFDFFLELVLYLFFLVSMDFLDLYYLSEKKANLVLIYTTIKVTLRMLVIIVVSYLYKDIFMMMYSLIAVEALKFIIVAIICLKKGLFTLDFFNKDNQIASQFSYIFPLGIAGVIFYFNKDVGKLIISNNLGVEALAIFIIGCYQVPIVSIIRSAISDTIFPEMVKAQSNSPLESLKIWKRANVLYTFVTIPILVILFFYADYIIETLFTSSYSAATPVFQVTLIFLLRQCFDFTTAIRAMNQNRYMIVGQSISLIVNLLLVSFLMDLYGLIGVAVSFLIADITLGVYTGFVVYKIYGVGLREIIFWKNNFHIILCGLFGLPILYYGKTLDLMSLIGVVSQSVADYLRNFEMANLMGMMVFSALYMVYYLIAIKLFKISDIQMLYKKISSLA